MVKVIQRMVAALLVVGMMVGLCACAGDTTWAAKVDGVEVSSGIYIFFLQSAYQSATQKVDADKAEDVLGQTIEDKPAKDWIFDECMKNVRDYAVTLKHFDELGLTLTAEENSTISSNADQLWTQNGTYYERFGVGKQTFLSLYAYSTKKADIFQKYYGEGGLEEVPAATMEDYFKTNYLVYQSVDTALTKSDASTGSSTDLTAEEKTAIQNTFNDMAKQINDDGKTFDEVYAAYQEAQAAASGTDEETAGTETETKAEVQVLTKDEADTNTPAEEGSTDKFSAKVAAMTVGKATVLEFHEKMYLIETRDPMEQSKKHFTDKKDACLSALKDEDFQNMVKGWIDAANVEMNDAAKKRYTSKNIDKVYKQLQAEAAASQASAAAASAAAAAAGTGY